MIQATFMSILQEIKFELNGQININKFADQFK